MYQFEPAFEVKEVSRKSQDYVRSHVDVFWNIFKPFVPYIIILTILDSVVTTFYMPLDPMTGDPHEFSLGSVISGYFYVCLVISWHRLVIHGPDDFEPMKPLKPKKSELEFIGMIFLLTFLFILTVAVPLGVGIFMLGPVGGGIVGTIIAIIGIKFALKLAFYFPAKATGNDITLRESFKMTTGYIWKLLWASFWAPLKMTGILLLYGIVGLGIIFSFFYSFPEASLWVEVLLTVLFVLPIALYFQPIITIISITVLSNYYQYALRKGPIVQENKV